MAKVIELGGQRFNAEWLRTVSEEVAVRSCPNEDHARVRNAWKQANGKTVRNYAKNDPDAKPKRKRTTKKKED